MLKKRKEYPEALLEIQNTGKTLLGIDHTLVDILSSEQLMSLFGSDETVATPKSYVLGVLLNEEGDVRRSLGEPEHADLLRLKSLSLLLDTIIAAGEPIEARHPELIDRLIEELRNRALPAGVMVKILHYQEMMGRYDRAENALYDIAEDDPAFLGEGRAFYRRLLARTDQELETGGLPRSEVREGMAALEVRRPPKNNP
jgi:hypothetical protein